MGHPKWLTKFLFILFFNLLIVTSTINEILFSANIVKLLLFLGIVLIAWQWKKCQQIPNVLWIWLLGGAGIGIIAAFTGIRPEFSLHRVLAFYLPSLAGAWIFWCVAQHHPDWLEEALLYAFIIPLLTALAYLGRWIYTWHTVGGQTLLPPVPIRVEVAWWSHPNLLAHVIAVGALLALSLAFRATVTKMKVFWQIVFALALFVMAFTGSRGGFVALVVGIIALLWFYRKTIITQWHTQKILFGAIVLFWSIYFSFTFFILSWVRMATNSNQAITYLTSLSGRETLWRAAWLSWLSHPWFGIGPGNYGVGFIATTSSPPKTVFTHAHNLLLHTLAEGGLTGLLVAFLGITFTGYVLLRQQSPLSSHQIVAITGLLYWGTHGIVEACTLVYLPCLLVWWALWALSLSKTSSRTPALNSSTRRIALATGIIALLLIGKDTIKMLPIYQSHTQALKAERWEHAGLYLLSNAKRSPVALEYFFGGYAYAQESWVIHKYPKPHEWGNFSDPKREALNKAIRAYQQGIQEEPWYPLPWTNLALLSWHNGEREYALSAMQTAVKKAPEAGIFHLLLGWMQEEYGLSDEALQQYTLALHYMPWLSNSIFFKEEKAPRQEALKLASLDIKSYYTLFAEAPCWQVQQYLENGSFKEAKDILPQCHSPIYFLALASLQTHNGASYTEVTRLLNWSEQYYHVSTSTQIYFYGLQGELWFNRHECQHAVKFYTRTFDAVSHLQGNPQPTHWMFGAYPDIGKYTIDSLVPGTPSFYPSIIATQFVPHYLECQQGNSN